MKKVDFHAGIIKNSTSLSITIPKEIRQLLNIDELIEKNKKGKKKQPLIIKATIELIEE